MADVGPTSFNDRVIAEFRAKNGVVTENGGFGRHLVLLHTTGARSGQERVNPTLGVPEGDGWLVTGSAAGAAKDPAWAHNLRARPDAVVEHPAGEGIALTPVTARELDGDDHARAWSRFTDQSPAFARYQRDAGQRQIPVFLLEPR